MFKICLENRITRKDADYKCYLCHYVIKEGRFDIIREHVSTVEHQEKLNEIDKEQRQKESEKLLELTGPQRKKFIENLITFERSSLFLMCHVCKCRITGLHSTLQHIDGSVHKKNLKNVAKQSNNAIEQKTNQVLNDKVAINKTAAVGTSVSVLQLGSNGIIFDETSNSHYCDICKYRIIGTPKISEHIQGLLHQALQSKCKVSNSTSIVYDEKFNSYECSICKFKIATNPNVTQHIQGFMHQTMLAAKKEKKVQIDESKNREIPSLKVMKAQKNSQTIKINNPSQDKALNKTDCSSHFSGVYCCKTCQIFMDNSTVLKCHVSLHLFKEFAKLRNFDLIKFTPKPNKKIHLECLLCSSFVCESEIVNADQELKKHFQTQKHLNRLVIFDYVKNDFKISAMTNQISDINLENAKIKLNQTITLESLCKVCNVPVMLKNREEHISGKNHNKNLSETTISLTATTEETKFNANKTSAYYTCFLCNLSFSEASNLLNHFKTSEHQWKIISLYMINKCTYMHFKKKGRLEIISCTLCKITMSDFKTAITHLLGKRHKEILTLPSDNLENQGHPSTSSLSQVVQDFGKLSVTTKESKLENKENFNKNPNVLHVKTKSLKSSKGMNRFEASIEELNQLGFDAKNIQPLSVPNPDTLDCALNDLVSLDFNSSQTKRLPIQAKVKAPRTPKVEDQISSFAKNVSLHGKNYIKFCIDSGLENIYNFDNEKISLMQLGIDLTFPYYSDRVCIPCEQQFPSDVQSLFEHLQKQEHLKNICELQFNDKDFEQFPGQFSDLRLAKCYMHVSDQGIQCNACNVKVDDNDIAISKHVEASVHKEKCKPWKEESEKLFNQYSMIYKDIWYHAQVFFCEVCKKRYDIEMDFIMHLTHPEHMKKVYQLKIKGTALTFDLCPSCITYWYGQIHSYELHCQSNFHKRFAKNKDFMVPKLTTNASEYLENVDTNVVDLIRESDKANLEYEKEDALIEAIVNTVTPAYPNAQVYVFGSRISDLGFPDSDVDVFLDCENTYYTSSSKERSQKCIKSIENYFKSTPNEWIVEEVLLATRVPIIKLRHIPTTLKCDISVTNGLSIEKSKLLGLYNRAFPICRKLILFMKKWLTLCRIFGSDYITTFAISWCVVFYLQLQGILPTVHELMKRKKESKIVDGWECGFQENVYAKDSILSFKEHLKGFFTYFATFDYRKNVICPYLGRVVDKHTFAYTSEVPREMDLYKNRLAKDEIEIFRFDSPMCIQDPIDLSQNLTKAVRKLHLRYFRQYCLVSAEKC